MIYQDDPRFNTTPIKRWGCFYLASLWYVALLTKVSFNTDLIVDVLKDLQKRSNFVNDKPIVTSECFVNTYDGLARYFGVKVLGPARHGTEEEIVLPAHQQLLVYRSGDVIHATAGQHHDVVTYDPLRDLHKHSSWYLDSRRVFAWSRRI